MAFLPKQAADSCLRRARRFLDLAENSLPVTKAKNDLRRMALVMGVAAVDSYMHAVVLRRIADVRRRADLPKALARLDIPFSEIADLANAFINAQRSHPKKGSRPTQRSHPKKGLRPWVRVKASLQRRLLKETFQSYDQVGMAFAIAGIDKAWSQIGTVLGENCEYIIKPWLNDLVHRRNQIVHEGDMKRASRPRKLRFNDINHAEIKGDIDEVAKLISAMDMVVTNHP